MASETDRKIAELLGRAEQLFYEVQLKRTNDSDQPIILGTFNMYTGLLLAQQIGNLRDSQAEHEKALVRVTWVLAGATIVLAVATVVLVIVTLTGS